MEVFMSMTGIQLPTSTASVVATNATQVFSALTAWMPTISIQRLRCVVALMNKTPGLNVFLAIQTATVDTQVANAPVQIGAIVNAAGRFYRDIDVTNAANGDVNNHMWFRLGVLAASGGAVETGNVAITPSFR
jgi:hypothetical protein